MNPAFYKNAPIGSPVYQGLTLGGILEHTATGTFEKADYPGLRAIKLYGQIILAKDLADSEDIIVSSGSYTKTGQVASSGVEPNARTYTNNAYLDLDALTGGGGTAMSARIASLVLPSTAALVTYSAQMHNSGALGLWHFVSYRVHGATTVAANDNYGIVSTDNHANEFRTYTRTHLHDGLTPGLNNFELQAKIQGGGTGGIHRLEIVAEALIPGVQVELLY